MLQLTIADAVGGLKKDFAAARGKEPFSDISRKLILPGGGHSLLFQICGDAKEAGRRILSVTITPKNKNHTTTRYVFRGNEEALAAYLETTPEADWTALAEGLVRGCDSFYYP